MGSEKPPTMGLRVAPELRDLLAEAALAETKRTGKHVTVSDILRVGGEKEARRVLRKGEPDVDRVLAAAVERLADIQRTHAVCPGASGWAVAGECIQALRALHTELVAKRTAR